MTEIQPAHSTRGASSYSRWSKIHGGCPGSVKLSEGLTSLESEYAKEGTLAHEIAANTLDHYFFGKITPTVYKNLPHDMMSAVKVYVDFIINAAHAAGADVARNHVLIEHRFDMSKSVYPGLFGTSDAVIYFPKIKKLLVADYKHGAGIAVEVEDNLQLQYYALGALLSTGFPCNEVEIVVVQPRCGDDPIRKWKFSSVELLDFAADLASDAAATEDPNAAIIPGKHCRFCPAAPTKCTAIRDKAVAIAKTEFKPVANYDAEKLAQSLAFIPAMEAWIKQVHEFAYAEAVAGRMPPGWKLVPKRATRKWVNTEEEIVQYMKDATKKKEEEFYERKLKTPAQMEKLLSKQLGEGLRKLMESVSSGYNLVPESDDRQAAKLVDAATEFTKIEGNI